MSAHPVIHRGAAALAMLLALQGCALFSKNDPLVPRYFTPSSELPAARAASTRDPGSAPQLRLGNVIGGDHLRERLAYRTKEGELGYHDGLRWTERPEEYVRRALARALFEERGILRVVSGAAPTLALELTSFEEVRSSNDKRLARVVAVVIVHNGRFVLFEQTVTAEEPVDDEKAPTSLVHGISRALDRCVAQIADNVLTALATLQPANAAGEDMGATRTTDEPASIP